MAWDPLTSSDVAVGKSVNTTKMQKIKNCFEFLYGEGALLKGSIPNGNFEMDADSDGIPDGWTRSLYAGGAGEFDETTPMEGIRSWKFTHPGGGGNGGGVLTSDYIEISAYANYCLRCLHYASTTGVKDLIQVQYYDKDKVANGSAVDIYNSTACATSPDWLTRPFTPTANSEYLKVKLTGGHTDATVAGISYFDDVDIIRQISGAALPAATAVSCTALVIDYPTAVTTTAASWTTLHSWKINRTGIYTISFGLVVYEATGGGATAYGRIYKNGIAFGTSHSVFAASGNGSQTFSEDLEFAAGDIIDFKGYKSGTCTNIYIAALKFYANDHTFAARIS